MKKARKLSLDRETLSQMNTGIQGTVVGNDSCVDSCYLVSCGGGCGISTGLKD
jgi:hypothetical protein